MNILPPRPLAAYETEPFLTLTDDQLHAIVDRHDLAVRGEIAPMPSNGVVHALWSLGDDYVLRVPKAEALCLGDLHAEVVAIPIARAAGVRTPDLIGFDDTADLVEVPYTIVERVHGVDLARRPPDDPANPDLYRQLGLQLATLHRAPKPEPHPWLRPPESRDVDELLAESVNAGMLSADVAQWFASVLASIEPSPGGRIPSCFLHNDVKPDNVMLDNGGQVVLIDWGDATIGDPALDLACLPAAAIADTLAGYREIFPPGEDPTLERRVARTAITNAIAGLRRSPALGPSWYRPLATGVADLLGFATDQPDVWRGWLGRA
ncbi:MAG: aminoglycoside phosphotransferase family protein [Acidimicrobiia bacterium]|nr:aminoglycoside phosphotransferase family protein [Acidimicrobiia bacterium]